MTVREALFEVLRDLQLTTIFGNIGSTEEEMFTDFPDDFRYVLSLHEAVVVAMADAYSQSSGKPVHVNLHTAAGTGDALGAIVTAWYNRTPMIITGGNQTREMLLMEPYLTNKNPNLQLAPWVKWAYEPYRAEDVPGAFLRAYAMAIQSPPGPVFLSLPMDDMTKPCPQLPKKRTIHPRITASTPQLEPVADGLAAAKKPVLILGGAVDQCGGWYDAIRLAEKLRCDVYGAPLDGRPGFPEDHPQYRGSAAPSAFPLCEQLKGVDVVVVIGAPVFRFYPYTGGPIIPEGIKLFHLTDSAEEAARAPVGDSFLVDPGQACTVLADLVPQATREITTPRERPSAPTPPEKGISYAMVFQALAEQRPEDCVFAWELPSFGELFHEWLPANKPHSKFAMYSGVLGYGLPAACGAALAERDSESDRKVICLHGDGSCQYTIQAFWDAAQQKLPILFIVLRNHEYGVLQSYANFFSLTKVPGFQLPGIDISLIARGYGVPGETVSEPGDLDAAITRGLESSGPYLIQVDVVPDSPPLLGPGAPTTQAETLVPQPAK